MAEPNIFQSLAESFDTSGRFARTRIAEEELERRREADLASQEQGQAQALGRKLEIYQGLLQGVEDSTRAGETAPEELEMFRQRVEPVIMQLQEQMGTPVGPMPAKDVQPDAPELLNNLDKLFAMSDDLNEQLAQAEESGDATAATAAQRRLEAVQGAIEKESSRASQTQVVETGGRKRLVDLQTGNVIKDLGAVTTSGAGGSTKEAMFQVFQAGEGGQEALGMFPASEMAQFQGRPEITARKVGTGSGGMRVEMDADGRVRSVALGGSAIPIGLRTSREKEVLDADRFVLELSKLRQQLRREDVGFAGAAGELFIDKGLGQFQIFQDVTGIKPDAKRIENRGLVRSLREKGLRTLTTDGRLNTADRRAVTIIFPEDGVFESYESAIGKMIMLEQLISDRAAINSTGLDRKPISTMTPDEIIDAAKNKNQIPMHVAKQFLIYLHGFDE